MSLTTQAPHRQPATGNRQPAIGNRQPATATVATGYNCPMRGRVVVLFLLSPFLLSAAGFAQCSYSPLYSGQYRSSTIYAATSNGLVQYDLFDPQKPIKNMNSFPTTSPNVLSLALSGSTLYAANGGGVDVFSVSIPTLPQKTSTIASLSASSSVKL